MSINNPTATQIEIAKRTIEVRLAVIQKEDLEYVATYQGISVVKFDPETLAKLCVLFYHRWQISEERSLALMTKDLFGVTEDEQE